MRPVRIRDLQDLNVVRDFVVMSGMIVVIDVEAPSILIVDVDERSGIVVDDTGTPETG